MGTYTVKLTVNNDLGSDEEIKEDYITVTDPAPKTWYVDDLAELTLAKYRMPSQQPRLVTPSS